MKRSLPLLLVLASSLPAMAHPAAFHSMDSGVAAQAGFLHPFAGLDHLLVMVAVGLWAAQIGGRALWMLPASFVGSMLLGGSLGILASNQQLIEHGILASIIMFAVALGMAWRPSLLIASLCAGAAGLCHGFAHGSEMPVGMIPALFLAGMVASTALLHTLGVILGLSFRRNSFPIVCRTTGLLLLAFALSQIIRPF